MSEIESRIKQALYKWPKNKPFTAADLEIRGKLTLDGVQVYAEKEIETALQNLVKDRFLSEARLERRRGAKSYLVKGGSRHPWRGTKGKF